MIKAGYCSGLIGRIIEMHARYYSRTTGFGVVFETKVARELAEFATRLDRPGNMIWHAEHDGLIIGSIAIDGCDLGQNRAHLRWFIIDDGFRAHGLGKALLDEAIGFCDRHGFDEVHLWTLKGLDAARQLYERNGFELAEEYRGDQWGREITEQKYIRSRAHPAPPPSPLQK
ncbi:MAG: GNAT family N-acetyltransferase [Geminicoccaceae bacterium]